MYLDMIAAHIWDIESTWLIELVVPIGYARGLTSALSGREVGKERESREGETLTTNIPSENTAQRTIFLRSGSWSLIKMGRGIKIIQTSADTLKAISVIKWCAYVEHCSTIRSAIFSSEIFNGVRTYDLQQELPSIVKWAGTNSHTAE